MKKIYLLECDQEEGKIYKIGVTQKNISERIKELDNGNPKEIRVVSEYITEYPYKVEKFLHRIYDSKKVKGEWFKLNQNEVKGFLVMCDNAEKNFNMLEEANNPYIFK